MDLDLGICRDLHTFNGNQAKCIYIKTNFLECQSTGYINYLQLFYCNSNQTNLQSYILFFLWLLLLFYLLGDTASTYFCSSLKGLSKTLNLSPTVAGVTLLSLGNGAPDVFASIVSFIGDDAGANEVGINSILGGAFFVSTAVVGIICISIGKNQVSINRNGFIRDVLSLMFCLSCLATIVFVGKLNLFVAVGFLFMYTLYVFLVSASEFCDGGGGRKKLVLPVTTHLETPLLLPANSVSDEKSSTGGENKKWVMILTRFIMLPIDLPRRLTIPNVNEENWSKPFAVISVGLSPVFLGLIWIIPNEENPNPTPLLYLAAAGVMTGSVAFFTTNRSKPPAPEKRVLIPWLVSGFVMSIVWSYLLAEELVSLLLSLGLIIGISPSILGLTVLAWGNSLGDIVANLTMARNDGVSGAQIAITGCFCGPIFNTLVGLGLSFSVACWKTYPLRYQIPTAMDYDVYETMGFMAVSLVWSLVVLPMTGMKLGRVYGGGLLVVYLCFLSLKIVRVVGLI
ncbi:cation/calcium exchanger 1-like [Impatiens glandulifera]|uniref:cation/calcium exchanger 1-like n=1 Tax=Impatiens glandulifera TaxID=253017 RepID=UPI001FB188C2|nr:cation/calcium exchanger 1-like [Impatiens glandulifera]